MAVLSVKASELKYAASSTWTAGKVRQGVYSKTRYEGALRFADLEAFPVNNISISQITMRLTFGRAGADSRKYLTFYRANQNEISGQIDTLRGNFIGKLSVQEAYDRSVVLTFSIDSNPDVFSQLADYIAHGGSTLLIYVPTTRGTHSGGYCYDYLSVVDATMNITYEFLKSTGTLDSESVEAGQTARLRIDCHNPDYAHRTTWKFGSFSQVQEISAGTNEAVFTIPPEWLSAIPTALNGPALVTLETLDNSGASLGSFSFGFTITVLASAVPSIENILVMSVNDNPTLSQWGIFVGGKSRANIIVQGAEGIYGSTIKACSIATNPSVGSASAQSFETPLIYKTGTISVVASVTDTRGCTASKETSFSVLPYGVPFFETIEAHRCLSDGTEDEASGTYAYLKAGFGAYSLGNRNAASCQAVLTQVGGSYTEQTTLQNGVAAIIGGGNLAADTMYDVRLTLTNLLGTVSEYLIQIPSAAYVMHIKRGGKAIGFGMAAGEDHTASFGWKLKLSEPLEVTEGGTGGSTAEEGCAALGAVKKSGDEMTGSLKVPAENGLIVRAKGPAQGGTILFEAGTGRPETLCIESTDGGIRFACTDASGILHFFGLSSSGKFAATDPVGVACGGTGAAAPKAALQNLGIFYADALPPDGEDRQICLIPV